MSDELTKSERPEESSTESTTETLMGRLFTFPRNDEFLAELEAHTEFIEAENKAVIEYDITNVEKCYLEAFVPRAKVHYDGTTAIIECDGGRFAGRLMQMKFRQGKVDEALEYDKTKDRCWWFPDTTDEELEELREEHFGDLHADQDEWVEWMLDQP